MKKATHKFMGIIQMKMFGNDYVKQHDTRDCAAACMASVCNLYGLHISLLHMRELLKIDKNGTSMYALMEVANKVGFSCEVLQGNWQEFSGEILERKICLPAICHMHIDGLEHFVIVKKVTNKGVEFSLSTVNVKTKDFRWVMDFNIAHNKSKINSIETPDNSYLPSGEGYSIGALFALKTAGLDENGIPMFWKDGQKVSFSDFYGLEVNHDLFGDATLSSKLSNQEYRDLFTYVGTSEPKFTGGLINRFYYKNFDLTISGSFIIDQTVQETPFYDPSQTSPGQNYSKRMFDVWSSSNPNGKYPALLGKTMEDGSLNMAQQWISLKDPGNSFRNYDIWFKQMSYFRVNSIRLGYTLPSDIAKKLRLASMRVSLETRNPFVIGTSYKGYFDPETYGSIYAQPLAKTFSCGLDLTF